MLLAYILIKLYILAYTIWLKYMLKKEELLFNQHYIAPDALTLYMVTWLNPRSLRLQCDPDSQFAEEETGVWRG